ncbi:hypothetical protein Bca52824_055441 [Brassica carinata]|uniref:Uncharacterized protein n=1 Tax=Brassica carinata TaxID=52824 RepID=A0A8X7UNP4_BRACI|nr:hypothetical protein Bca52824_055441 [Brassica carinata]
MCTEDEDGLKTSFSKYIALCMPENVLQLIDRSLEKQDEVFLEDNEAESLTGTLAWSDKLEQEGLPELSIGKLSREFQEEANTSSERQSLSCFGELMFPCFISELVKPDQEILAGGKSEEILGEAARVSGRFVSSKEQFKGSNTICVNVTF